ncbi:hypothetical protein SETIT_6G154800v2 [Setaria italica]|uniref:Uncharacterized protein n=1 Tax=Setaria italica TaxID=4555 RepID=A0A368RNH8_SETIT|nr:hypothetical protein SETIT_6G154800v2 [Setaria italica]
MAAAPKREPELGKRWGNGLRRDEEEFGNAPLTGGWIRVVTDPKPSSWWNSSSRWPAGPSALDLAGGRTDTDCGIKKMPPGFTEAWSMTTHSRCLFNLQTSILMSMEPSMLGCHSSYVAATFSRARTRFSLASLCSALLLLHLLLLELVDDDLCLRIHGAMSSLKAREVLVTQFSRGGFVVGVTWNHSVADGAEMAQFLQAAGELAVGMSSPSISSDRWDNSLPIILPPSMVARPRSRLAMSSSTDRIKAEFCDHRFGNGRACTAFKAIATVLWRCRTRATTAITDGDPDSLTLLSFAVNLCKLRVMAASGVVASAGIVDLVDMIKSAKEEIPDRFKKDEDDRDQKLQPSIDQQIVKDRYNTLMMSSWRNVGFERADFGGGTPARVMCHLRRRWGFPICVINPPWKGKDGHDYF